MSKSCIKCKSCGFFMGNISCENKNSKYYKMETYVNVYGWKNKLCDLYKKEGK